MSEGIFTPEELEAASELTKSLPGAAQASLLAGLSELRRMLTLPSRLADADTSEVVRLIQGLTEKCYFNAGWHAAAPERPLPGSASTDDISASIQIMVDYLEQNLLPVEVIPPPEPAPAPKVGRPAKLHPFELINVLTTFNEARGDKSLWDCVKECHAEGGLDRNVTIDTHYSRINRALDKFKARFTNVLPFVRPTSK
jgi:hypothetical protein